MSIDIIGKQSGRVYLDSGKDCVSFADDTDDYGALFDCFGGVFDLEDAALG